MPTSRTRGSKSGSRCDAPLGGRSEFGHSSGHAPVRHCLRSRRVRSYGRTGRRARRLARNGGVRDRVRRTRPSHRPYVTRASLGTLLGEPRPDIEAIERHVPRADAVIVGHTHFDHALDVPAIARRTGARVFGSRSSAALCRAGGAPEERVQPHRSRYSPSRSRVKLARIWSVRSSTTLGTPSGSPRSFGWKGGSADAIRRKFLSGVRR